jgi:hypothetical protein
MDMPDIDKKINHSASPQKTIALFCCCAKKRVDIPGTDMPAWRCIAGLEKVQQWQEKNEKQHPQF